MANLLAGSERHGQNLQLCSDIFQMQELYDLEPNIMVIDATDSRMFEILKSSSGIDYAVLVPLLDSGRLIGSLHLGAPDSVFLGNAEEAPGSAFSHHHLRLLQGGRQSRAKHSADATGSTDTYR